MTEINFWEERLGKAKEPQEAPGYPDMGFDKTDPLHKATIARFIKPSDKVLDVCCGIGRTSDWFNNYTGVDFVPGFIEIAKELHPNKKFVCADVRTMLPFRAKEFDWAVMISPTLEVNSYIQRVARKVLLLTYGEPDEYKIYD